MKEKIWNDLWKDHWWSEVDWSEAKYHCIKDDKEKAKKDCKIWFGVESLDVIFDSVPLIEL